MQFVPNTVEDTRQMLETIGVRTVDDLLEPVPAHLRHPALNLPPGLAEMDLMAEMRSLARKNSGTGDLSYFLGAGAYHHYIPAPISELLSRSEFYTAYTPYQPEISQGTLQAIFEYQSMICSLTGMDVANASMYDGATALAEAALMAVSFTRRNEVVVSGAVHPQYRSVLSTYLRKHETRLVTSPVERSGDGILEEKLEDLVDEDTACVIVQQPDFLGGLRDLSSIAERIHRLGGLLVVSSDPVALGMVKSPGEWGADIAVGEGQGLGNPMAFGGPYLGILACRERLARQMPGRLIGASTDGSGRRGFLLTLQGREQHIRREKATSNICTSEALVALAATVYLALMGPNGLRQVARLCFDKAHYLARQIASLGAYRVLDGCPFFNEFVVAVPGAPREVNRALLDRRIVGGYDLSRDYPALEGSMLFCATETNTRAQIASLVAALGEFPATRGGLQ